MNTLSNQAQCCHKIQIPMCFVLSTVLFTSCVSYKTVTKTQAEDNNVEISTFISPGNVIKITMKSGEEIEKMKVQKIDSEKISGIQWVEKNPAHFEEGGRWIKVKKTIEISEIQRLRKRKFSPLKTLGTVVGGLTLVAVIAVSSAPPPGKIQLPPNLFKL